MTKPTVDAEYRFRQAQLHCTNGILDAQNDPIARGTFTALTDFAEGLVDLAVGLRATYMLLEEVNRKLDARPVR